MRNKEQKGDLSVQAIAGTHVVLLGMDLPEQKCPGLLGFALRREDHTEGEKYWLSGYKPGSPFRVSLCTRRGAETISEGPTCPCPFGHRPNYHPLCRSFQFIETRRAKRAEGG